MCDACDQRQAARVAWHKSMSHSPAPVPGAQVPLPVDDVVLPSFDYLVALELFLARSNHRRMVSAHECLSVIHEEFVEFQKEVFKKREQRDEKAMLYELIQLAAMCCRAAEDLGLMDAKGYEVQYILENLKGGVS